MKEILKIYTGNWRKFIYFTIQIIPKKKLNWISEQMTEIFTSAAKRIFLWLWIFEYCVYFWNFYYYLPNRFRLWHNQRSLTLIIIVISEEEKAEKIFDEKSYKEVAGESDTFSFFIEVRKVENVEKQFSLVTSTIIFFFIFIFTTNADNFFLSLTHKKPA